MFCDLHLGLEFIRKQEKERLRFYIKRRKIDAGSKLSNIFGGSCKETERSLG